MDNTIPTSPATQWMDIQMPCYQQTDYELQIPYYENFSHDSTIMTTSPPNYTTYTSVTSPENSSCNAGNGDQVSPKTSTSKPVRRRSRASKKTPTTLVNASISNFRAVVQQYTGCHTSPIKNQKGPINLSFGPSSDDKNDYLERSIGEASQYGYYYHKEANKELQQEYFQVYQDVQENIGSPAGYSNSGTSMLSVDDYECH